MKELAMHVYDLMENSTVANSTEVKWTIRDTTYMPSPLKTTAKE